MASPAFHFAPDWRSTAANIHASGRQFVIALTGGGSGTLAALMQTPGASRSVLEAVVPYSLPALTDWLGGQPDQACSEATARAIAMAALMRARTLAAETNPDRLIGFGLTASLATDRPKRGPRRLHAAVQTINSTAAYSLPLTGSAPTRAEDEATATALLLSIIAVACGVDDAGLAASLPATMRETRATATPEQAELLLGRRSRLIVKPATTAEYLPQERQLDLPIIFPGAFNPPHVGHLRMAEIAERRLGRAATWELSIANVDKPPLDFIAIRDRVEALRNVDSQRLIALSFAPTFREKSALFPGAMFVVGADTLLRIAEPRYYGGAVAERDQAIADIARRGCRFLTFGRLIDGRFTTLSDLNLPPALTAICDDVPAAEFREDVSSTELRQAHDANLVQ